MLVSGSVILFVFVVLAPYAPEWGTDAGRTVTAWRWNWVPGLFIWVMLDLSISLALVSGIIHLTGTQHSLTRNTACLFCFMMTPSVAVHWYASGLDGTVSQQCQLVRLVSVFANVCVTVSFGAVRLKGTGSAWPFVAWVFTT